MPWWGRPFKPELLHDSGLRRSPESPGAGWHVPKVRNRGGPTVEENVTTLPAALRHAAQSGAGKLVFHLGDREEQISSSELADRATAAASVLTARGIRPGDAVGVLGPNRPEWAVWTFATWLAGAVLVPLPVPLLMRDRAAYTSQIASLIQSCDCRMVVGDGAVLPKIAAETIAWDHPLPRLAKPPEYVSSEDQPAVIQFSSGSTAVPKGTVLTHRAVVAQMRLLDERIGGSTDRMVGWAPFFHDLGLFLYLVYPLVSGRTAELLPTERFAQNPLRWFQLLTSSQATFTLAPASAFAIASRLASRRPEGVDLSALQAAWFGAEPIDPKAVERLLAAAPDLRLCPSSLGSGYGLAEAVLAVSTTRPGEGLSFDRVDLDALAERCLARQTETIRSRRVASCGQPLPETDIRIVGRDGAVPERQVGEVQVKGPSIMSHYIGEATADPFAGEWLRTGDLGYLAGGELYITGRTKDMVVVMGQNFYPEDFEWAAQRVGGIRAGHCVAFSDQGAERVVVLVEVSGGSSRDELRADVRCSIAEAVGLVPVDVVVVPHGTVLRTTSGKVRRGATRQAYGCPTATDLPG
jgi:fatty-acyl-CoA synthase